MNTYSIKSLTIFTYLCLSSVVIAQTRFVTIQPESRSVHPGSSVIFGVGTVPGQYTFQWLLDGEAVPNENEETITVEANEATAGIYTLRVSNGEESELSAPAILTLRESIGVALDQEILSWSARFSVTGEHIDKVILQENYWLSQSEETFDGNDAVVIKSRPNELDAYLLEGDLSGAFTVKFKWKAERPDMSFLQFRVREITSDKIVAAIDKPISGQDWEEVSTQVLVPGNYRLSWIFATVYTPEALSAWIDQVDVQVHNFYEVWTILNFSDKVRENLGPYLASTDSDGDGVPNQLEWALLSDPNKPDTPLDFYIIEMEGKEYAAFSFKKNPSMGNFTLVMESSANLTDWAFVNPVVLPPESTPENEDKTVWRSPWDLSEASDRFLRLKVQGTAN